MEDEDVLFKVTKAHLDTGLRGFPVGYCTTSYVHPEKGLYYADLPVAEITDWEPERVISLLYHGHDDSKSVSSIKEELKKRAICSPKVIKHISQLPREGHPMALYSAAILILGMFEGTGDYREDCLNLIAKIPHLTAAVIHFHGGWGEVPSPKPDLGYVESFVQTLKIPGGQDSRLIQVFKLFNILHYDHGGGNLSTFVGKAVASGLEDLYGSIAAAMNALAGPRHGRANQECLHFVEEALQALGEKASETDVEAYIRAKLERKELIYGFGHAVLRVEDPRATVQYALAKKFYPDHPLVKMAFLIRTMGSKVLKENPKVTDPYPNVDAISGTLLTVSGFPYPQYFTVLFGFARSVGIAIQIVYDRLEARDGKGTPIVRPKYLYKPRT